MDENMEKMVEIVDAAKDEGRLGDVIGVAALGLAAYGTVCLGSKVVNGGKKLFNKIFPKKEESKEEPTIEKEDVEVSEEK